MADGDAAAFQFFFHTHNPKLYAFIKRITKTEYSTEELLQDVFMKVWIHRVELSLMEFPVAWMYRVASNVALSYLRKKAAEKISLESLPPNYIGPERASDLVETQELTRLIGEAVKLMPPRRQMIYKMSREQGLTHKEIAERTLLSQSTVKDHLVLALKSIREYVRKETGMAVSMIVILGNL